MILAKGITIQHDALNVSYYAKLMHGKVNGPLENISQIFIVISLHGPCYIWFIQTIGDIYDIISNFNRVLWRNITTKIKKFAKRLHNIFDIYISN